MSETFSRPGQRRERRPIENAYWVVLNRFLAGEYPMAGDPLSSYKKIEKLVKGGVTCFMDLTDPGDQLPSYAELVREIGGERIELLSFPLVEHGVPASPEQVVEILDAIDHQLRQRRGMLYLHCLGGVGRTGVIVACWLGRLGFEGEKAMLRYQELWSSCPMSWSHKSPDTDEQAEYILNWREPEEDKKPESQSE